MRGNIAVTVTSTYITRSTIGVCVYIYVLVSVCFCIYLLPGDCAYIYMLVSMCLYLYLHRHPLSSLKGNAISKLFGDKEGAH